MRRGWGYLTVVGLFLIIGSICHRESIQLQNKTVGDLVTRPVSLSKTHVTAHWVQSAVTRPTRPPEIAEFLRRYADQSRLIDYNPQATQERLESVARTLQPADRRYLSEIILNPNTLGNRQDVAMYLLYLNRSQSLTTLTRIASAPADLKDLTEYQINAQVSLRISALRALEKESLRNSSVRGALRQVARQSPISTIRQIALLMARSKSPEGFSKEYLHRLLNLTFEKD